MAELLGNQLIDDQTASPRNNLHWLSSRVMIATLFTGKTIHVVKDVYNKPKLYVDGRSYFISISHSFQYAVVLISDTHEVAVDIEKYDARIDRVKHKFCSTTELAYASTLEQLTIIWSAKETLYKYYGKKEVLFQTELQIESFETDSTELIGCIRKNDFNKCLTISKQNIAGYCLTWIVD